MVEQDSSKCHFVYILQSMNPKHPNRTYVGYTNNPKRRLRQHNGEIKGGAKYTQIGRPYKFAACIGGFQSHSAALQFEWRCHNPAGCRKRKKKNQICYRYSNYAYLNRKFKKYTGMKRRRQIVEYILSLEKATSGAPLNKDQPLTIYWFDEVNMLDKCQIPHKQKVCSCLDEIK